MRESRKALTRFETLLSLLTTAAPELQLDLMDRVTALLCPRGFEGAVNAWTDDLKRLRNAAI